MCAPHRKRRLPIVGLAWAVAFFCCAAAVAEPNATDSRAGYRPGPLLEKLLDGPMAGVDEIVFAVRVPGRSLVRDLRQLRRPLRDARPEARV